MGKRIIKRKTPFGRITIIVKKKKVREALMLKNVTS